MHVAVVTPLDARSTGVADYALDLLPHLAHAAGSEVMVFSQDMDRLQSEQCGWTCRRPQSCRASRLSWT